MPSPAALHRSKSVRIILAERLLLIRRKFDHAPGFIGIAERREDFAADAKIGMVHVRVLSCFRQTERDFAKILGGHNGSMLQLLMISLGVIKHSHVLDQPVWIVIARTVTDIGYVQDPTTLIQIGDLHFCAFWLIVHADRHCINPGNRVSAIL